jgi:hypothetical protein
MEKRVRVGGLAHQPSPQHHHAQVKRTGRLDTTTAKATGTAITPKSLAASSMSDEDAARRTSQTSPVRRYPIRSPQDQISVEYFRYVEFF